MVVVSRHVMLGTNTLEFWKNYLDLQTSYHPQRDGMIERFHITFKSAICTWFLTPNDELTNIAKVQIITEYAIVDVEAVRNGEK